MRINLASGQHSLLPSDIIDFAMLPAQRARAVGKKIPVMYKQQRV